MVNCRRRSSARCSTDRSLEEEQRRRSRRDRRHRLEVRRAQIGHVHDNEVAGFQFLKALHDELIRDAGEVAPARFPEYRELPCPGPDDVPEAAELFRINYEWLEAREDRR